MVLVLYSFLGRRIEKEWSDFPNTKVQLLHVQYFQEELLELFWITLFHS